MLDGPPRLAEVRVGEAEVAEVRTLGGAVVPPPRGRERRLQPAGPLAGVQTQVQQVHAGIGVVAAQPGRAVVLAGPRRGPGLPGLDVAPLAVEEPQALEQGVSAFFVQLVGGPQHVHVVRRVPLLGSVPLGGAQASVGEDAGEVVEMEAARLAFPLSSHSTRLLRASSPSASSAARSFRSHTAAAAAASKVPGKTASMRQRACSSSLSSS